MQLHPPPLFGPILALWLGASLCGAPVAHAATFPYAIETHVLDNGLTVHLVP